MYIELSEQFSEILLQKSNGFVTWNIVLNAVDAMRKGEHIICCENQKCAKNIEKYAVEMNNMDVVSTFHNLAIKFRQISGIRYILNIYISIVQMKEMYRQDGKRILVNFDIANSNKFWNATYFICENIDDTKYYKIIIDYLKRSETQNIMFTLDYNCTDLHGGGTTTAVTLEHYCDDSEYKLCLCILDSDKKGPDCVYGETARKVKESEKISKCLLIDKYVLNVHEIENLFFCKQFLEKSELFSRKNKEIFEKAELKKPDIQKYFDVKNGFDFKSIKDNVYMKDALSRYTCEKMNEGKCSCENKCDNIIINGCGRLYLKTLIEKYYTDLHFDIDKFAIDACTIPDFIKDEWISISSVFLTWCCAKKINSRGI